MTKPQRVKSVFNSKIAILTSFLKLADIPDNQIKIIKKKIWRIYDNIAIFESCSCVKAEQVFRSYIGATLQELRDENCNFHFIEIVRKYIWAIFSDLSLMETNLVWKNKDLIKGKKNE